MLKNSDSTQAAAGPIDFRRHLDKQFGLFTQPHNVHYIYIFTKACAAWMIKLNARRECAAIRSKSLSKNWWTRVLPGDFAGGEQMTQQHTRAIHLSYLIFANAKGMPLYPPKTQLSVRRCLFIDLCVPSTRGQHLPNPGKPTETFESPAANFVEKYIITYFF